MGILFFSFILSLSFGRCLDHQGGVTGHLLICLIISAVAALLLTFIIRYADSHGLFKKISLSISGASSAPENPRISVKIWLLSACFILILWIPVWLAYYPGIFAYDANGQLVQVIDHAYSTHHPLIHTLWLGACINLLYNGSDINAGVALHCASQMLIMAAIYGWIIAETHRRGVHRAVLIAYTILAAIWPVHSIMAISVTKDVVYSGLLVVLMLLLSRSSEVYTYRHNAICTGVITALVTMFRNNARYVIAAIIIYLLISALRKKADKKAAYPLIAGVLAGLLLCVGLKAVTQSRSGSPREVISIPIQQLARVRALNTDTLSDTDTETLDYLLGEDAADRYNEHLADPVKEVMNPYDPACLVKTWIRMGIRYPETYLDAWLYTTEGAWYVYDTSVNRIYGDGADSGLGYMSTGAMPTPEGYGFETRSKLPGLKAFMDRIINDNAFEGIPVIRLLFSPALYIWILAAYWCIMRKRTPGMLGSGTTAGILLLVFNYLTLLLGPAVLVRYMYPYFIAIILPAISAASPSTTESR